ncbi:MAG: 30S ribosomal protein S10 [Candidatus Huberarchaeum crystalense]|uniref:Small ribosomal subunit protein uS10 n=1 Tax=Huberarchaeum crystalense TaxID=2014257 RepID=A0A2G9LJ65_HUBC1|nr:30S ribosomal protein S10 [archaeon]OIP20797.1 MAG: 30S ribosomal protein S10 [archaeon CG2_30_31_98]PIN66586.1 MAG: 30S ribosomal protein S10 [Candidatus Huberarchaeum crystalense]NCS98143.1 30S ribosomal protein S10 [archaeon]PIV13897.1 MAG: 30S ribosomal protein S10 [Candidatus Huberarchaeum crystalense]
MAKQTKIKLTSTSIDELNNVISLIKEVIDRTGANVRGPVPLPTKILRVSPRKSPCGEGVSTYHKFQMRIHRRIYIFDTLNDRALQQITRLPIPTTVKVELFM